MKERAYGRLLIIIYTHKGKFCKFGKVVATVMLCYFKFAQTCGKVEMTEIHVYRKCTFLVCIPDLLILWKNIKKYNVYNYKKYNNVYNYRLVFMNPFLNHESDH